MTESVFTYHQGTSHCTYNVKCIFLYIINRLNKISMPNEMNSLTEHRWALHSRDVYNYKKKRAASFKCAYAVKTK